MVRAERRSTVNHPFRIEVRRMYHQYSFRGRPERPALFNGVRRREWERAEEERGNGLIKWVLISLDAMDRHERYFDPEWFLETWGGKAACDMARIQADFLRIWAYRLEKWADTHLEQNG
jgi:hypothetical protein